MSERAVSKVTLNGTTLIDVTQDTVAANNLLVGKSATGADGNKVSGAVDVYDGTVTPAQNKSGWVRPADWPDPSKTNIENEEAIYFTYDSSDRNGTDFISINCTCVGGYTVELGTIGSDGSWTVEESTNVATKNNFTHILPIDRNYSVYKVHPTVQANHITEISMDRPGSYNGYTGVEGLLYSLQKCIERYGNLPYAHHLGPIYEYAYRGWGCKYLISETQLSTSSFVSMNGMYDRCVNLCNLDVSKWDVSNVKDMDAAFRDCNSLTYLDVSSWDTHSAIKTSSMFSGCDSLTYLDVSKWDVSNVTDMGSMFSWCSNLSILDISAWDVGNVTNMSNMFYFCSTLSFLDVSKWNVSNVTKFMNGMFNGCKSLTSIDVSKWDTSGVTTMAGMFCACNSLKSIDVSGWDTSSNTTMYQMFNGCSSIQQIDVSGWNTSSVTNMQQTFLSCWSLRNIDMSKCNVEKVTNISSFCENCYCLKSLDLSGWNTAALTTAQNSFRYCYLLNNIKLSVSKVTAGMFQNSGYATDYIFTSDFVPTLDNVNAFAGNHFAQGQRIRFKASLVDEAKAATNWSTYADYIEAIQE